MIERAAATRLLASRLTTEVVVSNLGQATLDLQRLADRPLNCYTFGSMGQCSSIGLGIALARPDVRVICLDGDGSLLMNLGSLCTIGTLQPRNYALVVWDNQAHVTTGGQPTATAFRSSLAGLARGAGIEKVIEPRDEAELRQAYDRLLAEDGPFVVPVKVAPNRAEGKLDRDVVGYARRFRQALAAVPSGPAAR
ncbi:MAG TPA: thiamine pyrophosphate-dependent enzyme [Methylomirabilota bacterium]|jgi:sulfopyruvate decarboxylase subunit beta|nr:thiamine pyrophosphate-dependent enzyme [Methylomirabilota bacterium]